MEVSAKFKNAQISPLKIRLVADQVRGYPVGRALEVLKFSTKKAAHLIRGVLESAIANAENNNGLDIDELRISAIQINAAPVAKRIRPRAKGRANRILKRASHITLTVSDERGK